MFRKINAVLIIFSLILEQSGFAQMAPQLPAPAYLSLIALPQDRFRPLHLRGVTFDGAGSGPQLLLDKGDLIVSDAGTIAAETGMLLRYFKTGLALPDSVFWVNLRPDAPDQVIDPYLEKTDLGKVLLEADLQLKKDLTRFTHPDTPEGRRYWGRLYRKAEQIFGPQNLTVPTLTRPWIVPGEIVLAESAHGVRIYKATLKVMLEQDYLKNSPFFAGQNAQQKELNEYSAGLIRSLILPKMIREVNSSKRYAGLRQVYYSLILARWFKQKSAAGAMALCPEWQRLIDTRDLAGLTCAQPWSRQTCFDAYRRSFAQGEYNKKEQYLSGGRIVMRQYFSGGVQMDGALVGNAVSSLVIPEGSAEFFDRMDEFIRLSLNPDDTLAPVKEDTERVSGPDGGLPTAKAFNQGIGQAGVTMYSGPALREMRAGQLESLWQEYKSFILEHTLALRMPVLKDFRPFPEVEQFNERFSTSFDDWFARETSLSGVPIFILYDPSIRVAYSLPVNTMGKSEADIFLYDYPDLLEVMNKLPPDARDRLQLRIGWGTNGGLRGFFILEKDARGQDRVVEFKGYTVNKLKSPEIYRSGDPLYCLNAEEGAQEAGALNELGAIDADFTRIDTYTVRMNGEETQLSLGQLRREGPLADFSSPIRRMGHLVVGPEVALTEEQRASLFAAGKNMSGQLRYLHERQRFNAGYDPAEGSYESYWHVNNVDTRGNLIDVVLRSFEEMSGVRYDHKNPEHIQLLFQFIRGDLRRFLIGTRSGGTFYDYGLLGKMQNKEYARAFLEGFIEGYLPEEFRIELQEKDLALFPQSTLVSRILKTVSPQRAHDREMREAQREYDLDFRLAAAFFLALQVSAEQDQQGKTGPDGGRKSFTTIDNLDPVAEQIKTMPAGGVVYLDVDNIIIRHDSKLYPTDKFRTVRYNMLKRANPALSIEEAAKTVIPEVAYLEMIAFRAGLINDVERISRIVALAKERKLRVVVVSNRSQDLASGTRDMIAQLGVSGIDEFHFVGRGNDTKAAKIKELMEADKVSHAVFVDDLKGNGQAVFDQISQLPGVESISVFHLQQQREERSYQDYLRSITVMLALKDLVDPGEFELLMVSALLKISEDPALRGLNELLDLIRKNGLNAPHFLGQGLVEEYFKELGVDLESDALDMEKIRKQAEREVKEEDVEDFARLLGFDDEVIVQGFSDTELAHWHDKVRQLRRAAAAAAAKAGNAVSLPTDLTAAEVEFFLEDAAQPPGSARERTPRSVLAQRFSNLLAFTLLMAATIFSGGLLLQHDDHQDDFITPDDSLPALTINKTAAFNNLTHSPMDSRYYENLKNYGTPPKVTTEGRKIFIGGVEYKVRAVAFSNVPEGQTFDDLVLDADHLSDHDLQLMQAAGVNTISTYYAPTFDFLDECMKYNIRVIVGIPYYDTRIHPGPDIKTGSYIDYMALYMNHPAVLWVKLGNEYNYHPEWFEGDVDNWYRAMDTAALTLKAIDTNHPVSTAQGYVPDIGTLDKLKNIDVIGINGYTFDDYSGMIADFKAKSPKPFIFTEAGTDSYNMITNSHDEASQAVALKHISRSIDNDPDCAGWTVFEWINEPVKGFGGWGNGPILGPLVRKFGGSGVYPDDMSNERYFGLLTEDGVPKMSYYAIMEEWSAREVLPIAAGEPEGGGPDGGAFALSTIAHALKSDFYSLYETAAGDVPVYIMRDHGLALAGWELARLKGLIYGKKEKRAGEKTVLVHFDEHHDMSDGQAYDLERPDLAIINLYYNVNQFIAPAVESGLVDEIYWVVPDDQAIDPEDSIQTYYSARLILSDGTTTAYLARQQPTQSSYPDLERIENMREVRVQKIHSRALPDLKGAGPAIVDIDADYFAFERRGGAEKDPGVIQAQIKETLDAIKEKVTPGVMTLAMSSGYTPENHTQLIMEKLVTGITGSADPQIERAVTLLNPMLAAWKMLHVPNRPDKAAEAPAEPARPVDQGQAREGGIDFRSLPLAGGPASAATDVDLLAAQLRQLAAASSITDLAQEWSRIEEQIRTQEVPWQRIKEFWAVCSQRGDGHHYKSRVVSCIVGMMRLEEESAVATPTQLKDLLVCMG